MNDSIDSLIETLESPGLVPIEISKTPILAKESTKDISIERVESLEEEVLKHIQDELNSSEKQPVQIISEATTDISDFETIGLKAETCEDMITDKIEIKQVNAPVTTTAEDAEMKELDREDTASEKKIKQEPSTSATPARKSETPDDLIAIIKNLPPDMLKVLQQKMLDLTASRKDVSNETAKETVKPTDTMEKPKTPAPDNSCVILLDSDDEATPSQPSTKASSEISLEGETDTKEDAIIVLHDDTSNLPKRTFSESECQPNKIKKTNKECINIACPRNESAIFMESPKFVMSFYYVTAKPNKIQWVCSSCFDKAVIKYEELCGALVNNEPMCKVGILQRNQDMIEILDSDDEDGGSRARSMQIPKLETETFCWNAELEGTVEEILQDFATKMDFRQQQKWEEEKLTRKANKNGDALKRLENELNMLEHKSSTMYNDLYSINKPMIKRRPSLDITSELEDCPRKVGRSHTKKSTPASIVISKMQQTKQLPLSLQKSSASTCQTKVSNASSKIVIANLKSEPYRHVLPAPPLPAQPLPSLPLPKDTDICYAVRNSGKNRMSHWSRCRLLETIQQSDGTKLFRVSFMESMSNLSIIVRGKELALSSVSDKLEIGTRVIAHFAKRDAQSHEKFMPGVIGEKMTNYNRRRYLVFFDYGQVQYAAAESVRQICEASPNVWEDVHENLRKFIFDYLRSQTQHQRALLNVRLNQQVPTERNGAWRKAVVHEIDCSIIKMHFPDENSYEWLYRGSKRLGPLYTQASRAHTNFQRRNDPAISYITIDDDNDAENASENVVPSSELNVEVKKNIAKKSTAQIPQKLSQEPSQQQPTPVTMPEGIGKVKILNDDKIYLEEPAKIGRIRHFTPRRDIQAKKYVAHQCNPECNIKSNNNLSSYAPLSKPLLMCWERQIMRQKNNKFVIYKAPCGRRLRNMSEIHLYLTVTKSPLNIDNFDLDWNMQVLSSYDVDKNLCGLYIPDMAHGREGMKIPVVNAFDDQRPPYLEYSPNRIPSKNVKINLDPEFLSCCDCTDDCADKSKCACFQMTIRGAKYKNIMQEHEDDISYVWKRLHHLVPTGIYECNERCKCSKRCLNKVVQQPIQVKMQLFRTKNRGWGLECCHDISKGTFLCIYSGNLYTEKEANALCSGLEHGDEYFAELDLIENAEALKEGYEAGIRYESDESEEEEKVSDTDSDFDEDSAEADDDFQTKPVLTRNREILTRSSSTSSKRSHTNERADPGTRKNSKDDGDSDDEMVNIMPDGPTMRPPSGLALRSFRKMYGVKEKVYIMDAKKCGNVGRYFNHSCNPNLFVQSVFVDTHDLRFPWIAFYAARPIKAGEELTWNYNYEVGSVPSKVLYCKCGAKNCRGRIL